MIAGIDEALQADGPTAEVEAESFFREAHRLLRSGRNGAFQKKYHDALQRSPEVVVTDHVEVLARRLVVDLVGHGQGRTERLSPGLRERQAGPASRAHVEERRGHSCSPWRSGSNCSGRTFSWSVRATPSCPLIRRQRPWIPQTSRSFFADLQPTIVARSKTNPPEALARSAGVLAEVAKLLRLPIHFSVVPDGGQTPELIPELARHGDGVPLRSRMSASPFLDGETRDAIAATGRKTLLVAGFATEVVVVHAVRAAIEAGYRVHVPVDACGGMSERTEAAAFRQIAGAGGVTTSVVELVTALAPDFSTSPGQQAFAALQALRLA